MKILKYRPWGTLNSVLSLSSQKKWGFIGTIGAEERSLCAWQFMKNYNLVDTKLFLQINPMAHSKYASENYKRLKMRLEQFTSQGGNHSEVEEFELMSELYLMNPILSRASSLSDSVVLDISSMPKRFYFLILRSLVCNSNIKNLIITYTLPESYTNEFLYEDIDVWKNLPGFGGQYTDKKENLIVSIGFLVESLNNYLSTTTDLGKISVMIPFPSSLSVQRRTWESVANLESDKDSSRFKKYREDTLNLSAAFDRIVSISNNPEFKTAFAPFGPKTFSAAMCLYAMQTDSAVYYPQPTVYHPEYSIGIKNNDPNNAINAYWIKHDGRNLYAV